MLTFAFTLQFLPPILSLIIEDMKYTHTQAGLLMSLFALPTIFLSILAGSLSDRLGPFRVGVISLILAIAGTLLFVISNSFIYIAMGRIISGIGAATIAIVAAQIISQWFRDHEIGTAMGIYNTAMPVGTIICYTTFGNIGQSLGWRTPIFISIIICLVGLITFLILYKPAPGKLTHTARLEGKKQSGFLSNLREIGLPIWLIGLCWMWFNAAFMSFSTFGPDFFVSKDYSITFAGFLVSLLMWGSLCMSPIIGRLVDKVNNHEIFIAVGGMISALAIYLITRMTNYLYPMILMSLSVAFIPAPVFSFPSKILKPQLLGLVFGILFTFSSLGMFLGPSAAGMVRDETGSYETTFVFLSMIAMLVPLTALFLRARIKKQPL
ncbi:MAG: MFS transporter [Candidatus Hodarchaeales archaeon]|jgi:predicted MFS family arabinose efflux permease